MPLSEGPFTVKPSETASRAFLLSSGPRLSRGTGHDLREKLKDSYTDRVGDSRWRHPKHSLVGIFIDGLEPFVDVAELISRAVPCAVSSMCSLGVGERWIDTRDVRLRGETRPGRTEDLAFGGWASVRFRSGSLEFRLEDRRSFEAYADIARIRDLVQFDLDCGNRFEVIEAGRCFSKIVGRRDIPKDQRAPAVLLGLVLSVRPTGKSIHTREYHTAPTGTPSTS